MSAFFTVEEIAEVCHEANRTLQRLTFDPLPSPPWSEIEPWQLVASVKGVKAALTGVTPAELHAAWCRDRAAEGWVYGPVKDVGRREHPCMVEYTALPLAQQAKDAVFLAIVSAMRGE